MIEVVYITMLTMLASFIGLLTGFGVSTIMIPILVLFLPFSQAIMLVGIIHWFNSIWQTVLFWHGINWSIVIYFGIPGIIASLLGALLIVSDQSLLFSSLLGLFLVSYAILLLVMPVFIIKYTPRTAMIGGTISGFFAGIFGIRGVIRSAFLSAFNLPKATYIATTGVISFIVDTVRLSTYWFQGISLDTSMLWGLCIFIPASLLGAKIAQYCVDIIPQHRFRTIVIVFLLFVGLRLLFFPV